LAERLYIDSSAYLAMLLGERTADEIERRIEDARLLSSVLLVLEATRTIVRLSREGRISAQRHQSSMERLSADLDAFSFRDLTLDLCRGRVFPIVSTPRSLDLVHLRTALRFHAEEPLQGFLSLDETQLLAARELGLPA
jgi:hypothetical protein